MQHFEVAQKVADATALHAASTTTLSIAGSIHSLRLRAFRLSLTDPLTDSLAYTTNMATRDAEMIDDGYNSEHVTNFTAKKTSK